MVVLFRVRQKTLQMLAKRSGFRSGEEKVNAANRLFPFCVDDSHAREKHLTTPLSHRQPLTGDWKLGVHGGWLEWMGWALQLSKSNLRASSATYYQEALAV